MALPSERRDDTPERGCPHNYRKGVNCEPFELSDKADQDHIRADLKHGVLTLNLPKAEEAKPRKIAVAVS